MFTIKRIDMFTTRGTTGRSILDHDFKRITRTLSNHTDPSQQSIILKQERIVSSMEIDNSRRSSFSEIRTAEFVSNVQYCKDQDHNKQITGNVHHEDGDGDESYIDDTEEELEEEIAVGMAYMSNSAISVPSDDVMDDLFVPKTAQIIDSMPS